MFQLFAVSCLDKMNREGRKKKKGERKKLREKETELRKGDTDIAIGISRRTPSLPYKHFETELEPYCILCRERLLLLWPTGALCAFCGGKAESLVAHLL